MKRAIQFGIILLTASLALAQQTRVYREGNAWVEETTGSMPAANALHVQTRGGNVTVQGGAAADIKYTVHKRVRGGSEQAAREMFNALRISATRQGEMAVLTGVGPTRNISMDFLVQAPRNLNAVAVATTGGNVSVTGVNGRVETSTGGGNVHLDDIGGPIVAQTAGGNVDVGAVRSDLTAKTGGGNVHVKSAAGRVVTATAGGNVTVGSGRVVTVKSGGGAIDVRECTGELTAKTGGGNLDIGTITGPAVMQSGGGSIRLVRASGPVNAETGGGAIELLGLTQGAMVMTGGGPITVEFLPGNFSGSRLETPAGDIIVYLSPQLKATVRARIDVANGHRIRSELPGIQVRAEGGQYGPKTIVAEGQLNGGGPLLTVHTTTGDIDFRKAKK